MKTAHSKRILTVLALVAGMFPVSVFAFWDFDFWNDSGDREDASETTSVKNDVSVSASTGGNSASGSSSSSGGPIRGDGAGPASNGAGSVTTGDVRASATIQTSVDDDNFEDIKIEIETEGEPALIERHVATSSGKVRAKIDVRVEVNATSSGSAAGARRESEADDEDASEQTNEGDVFENNAREEIGTATGANISELSERNRGRLRGLFRRLFSRLFSLFDF